MTRRADSEGLFWDDVETAKLKDEANVAAGGKKGAKRAVRAKVAPPIPNTGWKVRDFPRLHKAKIIAIDTETYDPDLLISGPGWARNKGHVVGISVAVEDAEPWYFPMRHTVGTNLDPENVIKWAKDNLTNVMQPKLFANASYDIGWLQHEGVNVRGKVLDVQIAEPLLDEYARSYSLETIGRNRLGAGKETDQLHQWLKAAYDGEAGSNIYRAPATLVGPYAERDVAMLFPIWKQQIAEMREQDLLRVYELEAKLVYLLVAMRYRGVRVDLDAAQRVEADLDARAKKALAKLGGINPNAPTELEHYCKKNGILVPRTAADNPSFVGEWLERNIPEVALARKLIKARDTFVRGYIFSHQVNGRLHCQFNQLRSDKYGTVSGRFSSSNPNLQNIYSRDDELAPTIRGLYVPDLGMKQWRRWDWSQIEFRMLTHHAVGRGAVAARQQYNEDADTDFHVMVSEIVQLPRKPTKGINFGCVYGMGVDTMAESLSRPVDEVQPMLDTYHQKLPFVRATFDHFARLARREGFIQTMSGRRARLKADEARKALNRQLQGDAADIMKIAMVRLWEDGLCDVVGVPQLTVHDELDTSDDGSPEHAEVYAEWHNIMQTCVKLEIPLRCEVEVGPDWGHVK